MWMVGCTQCIKTVKSLDRDLPHGPMYHTLEVCAREVIGRQAASCPWCIRWTIKPRRNGLRVWTRLLMADSWHRLGIAGLLFVFSSTFPNSTFSLQHRTHSNIRCSNGTVLMVSLQACTYHTVPILSLSSRSSFSSLSCHHHHQHYPHCSAFVLFLLQDDFLPIPE